MVRYSARSATSGNITLNSSRKGRDTLTFWFFANLGKATCGRDKWVEFDVRDIATRLDVEPPQFMTGEEMKNCVDGHAYEGLLCRDLQRAADWCNENNALAVIAKHEVQS